MASPYFDKCKRRRMGMDPTPCLCCPRECVGDDLTIQMLPEVEEMLRRRERTFTLQITGSFSIFGYRTREIDLTPALGLALLAGVVYLLAVTKFQLGGCVMKLLREIVLYSTLALAGCSASAPVTAAVTQANSEGAGLGIRASTEGTGIITASTERDTPKQPIKVTNWYPAIFVVLNGGRHTFTQQDIHFTTEAECKAHLASQEFRGALISVAAHALSQDENASMAGEPACVERAAPSKGA